MKNPFKGKPEEQKAEQPKEFTLMDVELSEAAFIAQQVRAKEQEVEWWYKDMQRLRAQIAHRLGVLDQNKYMIDWNSMFSTGKIFVTDKPAPKVEPTTQNEQELPKKQ